MKKHLIIIFLFTITHFAMAQEKPDIDTISAIRYANDSLIFIRLEQVDVYPQKGRKLNYRRYSRLVQKIRKVYPFAIDAAKELEKYNELFEKAETDKERRKYVRKVEGELFAKHEDELRRFTISEGRYLMLLVDRETGNTSYSIIKEVKGGIPAVFWQGIARIFNNDLREKYDPFYNHYVIEQIVLMIEAENKAKTE